MASPDLSDFFSLATIGDFIFPRSSLIGCFFLASQVKKNQMEIHALELEVNDMHGKFIIPQLKKVNNFKLMGGEEA